MTTAAGKKPAQKRTPNRRSPAVAEDPNQAELDEWADGIYRAVLPSSKEAFYRLPSLADLIAFGELPSDLQELAVAEWSSPGIGADLAAEPFLELRKVAKQRGVEATDEELEDATERSKGVAQMINRLNLHLVAFALVKPKATADQLARMPYRDIEMLSMLMNRGTGTDAAGRHVGVVPLDQFQIVALAHGAECNGAPACPACLEAGRELAQVQ